jgi:UDPglucose 6-dehydrogenase
MNLGFIGVGRLGLCTALVFEKNGFNILGLDINQNYINEVNNKTLASKEPNVENYLKNCKNLKLTADLDAVLNHSDIIFIVVDTPNSGSDKIYDTNKLSNVLININKKKVENKTIVICCTVMPGYIDEIGNELIKDCPGTSLNYNPEFIAQGSIIRDFENADFILIGQATETSGSIIESVYKKMHDNPIIKRMKNIEAEIVKISVNGFLTTKISYANMISDLCDKNGADANTVLKAIGSDSRIGTKYLGKGYGFGGPCLPRDTLALANVLKRSEVNNELILSVRNYNTIHNNLIADNLLKEQRDEYVFDGVCYKEGAKIPIIEESAKLKIAERIVNYGGNVVVKDNDEIINEVRKEYGNKFKYIIE